MNTFCAEDTAQMRPTLQSVWLSAFPACECVCSKVQLTSTFNLISLIFLLSSFILTKHWWTCYEWLPVVGVFHQISTLTSAFVEIDKPYFQKLADASSGLTFSPLQRLSAFTPWQLLSLKAVGCLCVCWTNSTRKSFIAWEGTVLQADVVGQPHSSLLL